MLGYEKMLDEKGREMHGSWGNMIQAEDAFTRMGADVMRWQYCAQPPDRDLLVRLRAGARDQAQAADALELGRLPRHVLEHRGLRAGARRSARRGPPAERTLDRWLVARTHEFVREAEAGYEATLTVDVTRAFEAFVEDLSNWYIRRSRRRFYGDDQAAFRTLWYAVVQSLRAVAPVMPFLTEHLWLNLVPGGPASIHLAGWPDVPPPDRALLDEMAAVREVVSLGHRARATSGLKVRQPLRRLVVQGAAPPARTATRSPTSCA